MAQNIDPRLYYGYLFKADKKPTPRLDALLRGLAIYIATNVGDRNVNCLTPAKLAAFYREVGGNYDSLFVDATHANISYIYQTTGCRHSLQPTSDDYAAPTIPALTPEGFARWQSIELLLDPQEHVDFMQRAVRTFPIKNPDTGESFPSELPSSSLPTESDPLIERWHNHCAEKLRHEVPPQEDRYNETPDLPARPAAQPRYSSHTRDGSAKFHPDTKSDYFAAKPPAGGPSRTQSQRGPQRPTVNTRPSLFRSTNQKVHGSPASPPREARPRRRSLHDENFSLSSPNLASPEPAAPRPQKVNRGQSQPRPYRRPSIESISSLSSDSPEETPVPIYTTRRDSHPIQPSREPHNIRFNVGSVPNSPVVGLGRRSHQTSPRTSPRNSVHHSSRESNNYDPRRPPVAHSEATGNVSGATLKPSASKRGNSRVRWRNVDEVSEFSPEEGRHSGSTSDEGRRYRRIRDETGAGARPRSRRSEERLRPSDLRDDTVPRRRESRRERRGGNEGEEKKGFLKRFVINPILGDYAENAR